MEETFADRLLRGEEEPLSYNGQLVYLAYERPVSDGTRLTVTFIRATRDPVQGLELSLDARERPRKRRGRMRINDVEGDTFILWHDSAPATVDVVIATPRNGSVLRAWNQWRDYVEPVAIPPAEGWPRGYEPPAPDPVAIAQGGLRWAGMLIEGGGGDNVLLRCSDGVGPVADFDDLVVCLVFDSPDALPGAPR